MSTGFGRSMVYGLWIPKDTDPWDVAIDPPDPNSEPIPRNLWYSNILSGGFSFQDLLVQCSHLGGEDMICYG